MNSVLPLRLYFAPRTSASRARWLLEELSVPYELVKIDVSSPTAELLSVSPLGELPALVAGDVTLLGASAICLFLADSWPEKRLAPLPGSPERAAYYQWLLFAEQTLQPAVMRFYGGASPEPENRARVEKVLDVIDAKLAGRDFLVAGHFTAADLVMTSVLHLANHLNLLESRPRLVEYVYLHCRRPACARAVA